MTSQTPFNGRSWQRSPRRAGAVLLALLLVGAGAARADDDENVGRTPPRLSFIEGDVSFWRPNTTDWERARVNTALAPGDQLYCAANAHFELQVGPHAFVRGDAGNQIALENQEPDFLQFRMTTGRVVVDLRQLDRGHTLEVDTPSAAFTFDDVGYYRIDIDKEYTRLITRRNGRAAVTPAGGQAVEIEPNEEVVIEGGERARLATHRAPLLDDWDRWNYDRTDQLLAANSDRYVPPSMYGTYDLDRYGSWRVVPTYGRVWVPADVSSSWAPYSTGRWLNDPYYGWTWVDDAQWGWAPYHYGRWVYVDSYWAWAPGPIAVAVPPVYAPALVAFFTPFDGVNVDIGVPFVSWVALGWGEPLFPWWGPSVFIGQPWWGGWCGPHGHHGDHHGGDHGDHDGHRGIHHQYQNVGVRNAVVTVRRDQFHGGGFTRVGTGLMHNLRPVRGALPIEPALATTTPNRAARLHPPAATLNQSVVKANLSGNGPPNSSRLDRFRVVSPAVGGPSRTDQPQPPPPPRFGQGAYSSAAGPTAHAVSSPPRTTAPAGTTSQPRINRPVDGARVQPGGYQLPPPAPRGENRFPSVATGSYSGGSPPVHRGSVGPPSVPSRQGTFSAPAGPSHFGSPPRSVAPPRAVARSTTPRMAVPRYSGAAQAVAPHFGAVTQFGGHAATASSGHAGRGGR